MTPELKVINAVCKNKDIHAIMGEDKELFGSYQDVFESVRAYYFKYKEVPDLGVLQERFEDLDRVDTSAPTAFYVEELRSNYVRNRMDTLMLKAAEVLETETPAKVLQKLSTELAKLGKFTHNVRDLDLTDAEAAEEHLKKLREITENNNGTPGIATGFKSIDSAYPTGMAPGHSIVCMGYTGRAKSMFANVLAVKAWEQGYHPMIVSLEMTPEEQRERVYPIMASGIFKISDMSRGDVSMDDFRSWSKKQFGGKKNPFTVVSNQGINDVTPNVIQAKIDTHRPSFVILDYLQLMMDNAKTQAMTPRMLNLSREVKMLAVTNNIPILSITAVTDEDGDKRDSPPVLSQVAWSKGIEYDANLAFAVHRHDDTNIVEVVGRKNRNGSLFDFGFEVDFDRGIWEERHDLF